jgi:hypothetical protein
MALLRVVAIELLSGFPDLLDDEMAGMCFDDELDRRVFMPRHDDEAIPLACDALILGRADLHRLEARGTATFTVIRNGCVDVVELHAPFDLLVDAAKDFLVARSALREVHAQILARRRGLTSRSTAHKPTATDPRWLHEGDDWTRNQGADVTGYPNDEDLLIAHLAAAHDLVERLISEPPTPKTNLAIVLLERAVWRTQLALDSERSRKR